VKTIEGDKKALEEKLKVLEVLKKNRTGPVKLMDELAQIIPTKVWLVDLAEDAGAIALKGRAASHEDVAIFLKKLKGSKHFKDIQLKKAMATASGVVDFDIMGKADYQAG
jgi:type IV pilus assembly protein PilN